MSDKYVNKFKRNRPVCPAILKWLESAWYHLLRPYLGGHYVATEFWKKLIYFLNFLFTLRFIVCLLQSHPNALILLELGLQFAGKLALVEIKMQEKCIFV
jgi:hypothetical protein